MTVDLTDALLARIDDVGTHTRDDQERVGGTSAALRGLGDDVAPPSGNTGVEITRAPRPRPDGGRAVSVGWLSCTWIGRFSKLEDFAAWAVPYLGELVGLDRRWRGYDTVYGGEHGVLVGLRHREGALELHADIPATVLEGLTFQRLYELLVEVALYARNVSRCDVTLDDWDKVVTPLDLDVLTSGGPNPYELNRAKLVTRAKESDYRRSKGPKGGDTWHLGGTKGEARLRVYDKARESMGEVDAIRWELQLRGDRAKDAVTVLALEAHIAAGAGPTPQPNGGEHLVLEMGKWAAAQLVRFVDFRDRDQDTNISRCDRLPWFVSLVEGAERARPVVVAPALSVERMHAYATRALPSWLATLADSAPAALGISPERWILQMLHSGRVRRSARHDLALRSAGVAV